MKICKKCGMEYEDNNRFCKKCGAELKEVKEKQPGKKKGSILVIAVVAVLAAALLGGGFLGYRFLREKQEELERVEEELAMKEEEEAEEKKDEKKEEKEKREEDKKKAEEEKEQALKEEKKRAEAEEQEELLKEYEEQERAEREQEEKENTAQAQADAGVTDSSMHQVLSDGGEVEAEVLRIRGIFTECMEKAGSGVYQNKKLEGGYNAWFDGEELKMINSIPEVTDEAYERIFIFENGYLIFAYQQDNGNQNRLYYKDGNIFRWSYPESSQIRDNKFDNPEFVQNGIDGWNQAYELYNLAIQ